jgi:hypothetical protein
MKRDRYSPLEAYNAQAGPKIIAPRAAFGKVRELRTIQGDALGVGARSFGAGLFVNEVIEAEQVRLGFRCEYDLTRHA